MIENNYMALCQAIADGKGEKSSASDAVAFFLSEDEEDNRAIYDSYIRLAYGTRLMFTGTELRDHDLPEIVKARLQVANHTLDNLKEFT
jgi:hypothetical protein